MSTQGPRVFLRTPRTRGQALSPSWLHKLGVAGDGFAEATQVANLFEEVEAVIVDNAALSQGDTTTEAPHVRHAHCNWHKAELGHRACNLLIQTIASTVNKPHIFASPDNPETTLKNYRYVYQTV